MWDQALYRDEVLVVEPHGIEPISEEERHGGLAAQFTVWFGSNMNLATILLGGLGISLRLGLWGTLGSIVLGNLLGSAGNALCAAMGPRLGMPQLAMSRSVFGYRGNYLPAFLAWLGFIGWFTVNNVLGARTAAQLLHTGYVGAAAVLGLTTIVIAVFGYNMVHAWERWFSWLSLATFALLTVIVVAHGAWAAPVASVAGSGYWHRLLVEFGVAFASTVSSAPYAADYARYLPAATPARGPFWYSFWGLFLSSTWGMCLGALLRSLDTAGGVIPAISAVAGGFAAVVYLVVIVGAVCSNVPNMYSGALSALAWNLPLSRVNAAWTIGAVGLALSLLFGGAGFVRLYKSFLFVLAYWVTPWVAIMAVDFYVFRCGGRRYPRVLEFYRRKGLFGAVRWRGLLAWMAGVAASAPFMASGRYAGPLAGALARGDVGYLIGFIVAGAIYLVVGRPADASVHRAEAAGR